MTDWFYTRDGIQNGPVSFAQLQELVHSGQIKSQDFVWNASMSDWQAAGTVDGLFGSQTPASDAANPYAAPQSAWQEPASAAGASMHDIVPGSDPIDVGACVKRGFELTKRNFGTILLVGLVYVGALFGLTFVGGILEGLVGSAGDPSQNSSAVILVTGLVTIVNQVVSILLSLGLIRIGLNFVSGKPVSVGQLFGEGHKLLPAIGASILFGIMVVIGFVLLIVPGIYISLRYGQFLNAMVDRDLGVMDSFSYSSSITTNNRLNLFVLGLLSFAIVIAGILALVLGLLFAYPLVWLAWMVAFRWMQYGRRSVEDHPGTTTPLLSGV